MDPLDDFDENSEIFEGESSENATPFPGYLTGASIKFGKKAEDDDDNGNEEEEEEEEENTNLKKPDDNEDLDEDLVTDNEDNFIYNSNRIGKENVAIVGNVKKEKEKENDSD